MQLSKLICFYFYLGFNTAVSQKTLIKDTINSKPAHYCRETFTMRNFKQFPHYAVLKNYEYNQF